MKCGICGGENIDLIDTKIRKKQYDEIKAYKCNSCEVHFLHPYYSEDQIKDYYDGDYRKEYSNEGYYSKEVNKAFFNRALPEAKRRHERVKKYLSENDDVLEIGCSSGYFLSTIKDDVMKISGVELDKTNIKYCEELGIEMKTDAENFDKKFDKIFMFHVLEHINDPISYVENLKKYIKDGGLLFIEVPNNDDALLSLYDIQEYRDFYYQGAHLWYFNKKSLGHILNKAGYDFTIHSIQRYSISNHLNWLKNKKPGGNAMYDEMFNDNLKSSYSDNLIEIEKTDTIFAICKLSY